MSTSSNNVQSQYIRVLERLKDLVEENKRLKSTVESNEGETKVKIQKHTKTISDLERDLLPSLTVFDFVSSTTMCHLILSHHPSHQLIAVFSFFQKVVTKNSHTHEEKSHFKVSHVPYIFELFPRNPISYIRFRGRKEIRYA